LHLEKDFNERLEGANMKYWNDRKGLFAINMVELIIAVGLTVFLLSWVARPIRAAFTTNNLLNYESQQRQASQYLDPVIEDIREAQSASIAWPYLDPTATGSYNPANFPWFAIPNAANPASPDYVCYYYDSGAKTLWRVKTNTAPANMTTCDPSVSGTTQQSIATSMLVPTASQPLFRGDLGTKTIYLQLHVALPSSSGQGAGAIPPSLTVVRMATPRN
jgi:hypothetical protein